MRYFLTNKRRAEIKEIALQELQKANITSLPVDILSVINQHKNWKIVFTNDTDLVSAGQAKVLKKDDKYIIVCHKQASKERKRWCISHEIGHLLAGKDEVSANYFTKQLLMPIAVLDLLNIRTVQQISIKCGVSMEAAKIRQKDFIRHNNYKNKYGFTKHDMAFIKQFQKEFNEEFAEEFYIA